MTPDEATWELQLYIFNTQEYNRKDIPIMKQKIQEFINQGADINRCTREEMTPFLMALWVLYDPELVAFLAEQGVNKSLTLRHDDYIYIQELGEEIPIRPYLNITNILLEHYHSALRNGKFSGNREREVCRQRGYTIYPKREPRPDKNWVEPPEHKKYRGYVIALLHKYCNIMNINYYKLINRDEKLPKDL